jgi:CelD/BcsL family acetyltransferase involved in cellulose biosynthesis
MIMRSQNSARGPVILRVVRLREIPEDPALLAQWNDLIYQTEHPQVFYTWEWALAMQSAYRTSRKPCVLAGYDGGTLVGIACLSLDASEKNASFLSATTADYCEFLSSPERRAEFVAAVFAELRQMRVSNIQLANVPVDSATAVALNVAAKKYALHAYIRPAYTCAQVELGSTSQRQQLQTTVARKRQVRRCLRALETVAPVTLAYLRSWNEIKGVLPDFFEAHGARFRAKKAVSFLSTPERRVFMEELARRFSQSGAMILTVLRVGDEPVAWSFGFQCYGEWFLYQTTFDFRWGENSPGYCLLAKILIEACGMSTLTHVDLGLGAESYKEWFANCGRKTLYATVTTSAVRHAREIARYRIASEVKHHPKLEAVIRSTRARLGV